MGCDHMEKIVYPGEFIGYEEEYIPGEGVAVIDGKLYATVMGKLVKKGRKVEVVGENTAVNLSVGSIVYGLVESINASMALVHIAVPRLWSGKRYPDFHGFAGLHVSKIKRGYLESISDAVRIGDMIKAKVIKIKIQQSLIDLSIEDNNLGVVLATCTQCRSPMKMIGPDKVKCTRCGHVETRKLSNDYGKLEVSRWK